MLPVAILAGGMATRLRPITEKIPKSLVDVNGRSFIFHQLEYLSKQGITDVVLCVSYLGERIQSEVGDGSRFGLRVQYSWDGDRLLGTGGALKKALSLLGKEFFVFYGDSYLPVNFNKVEQAFLNSNKPALITVLKNNDLWDKSNVLFRDGLVLEYDKKAPKPEMKYIDYGLGVLSAQALEDMPDNEPFDLADVYHKLSIKGDLAGLEVFERFYEIGSHKGLEETIDYFKQGENS